MSHATLQDNDVEPTKAKQTEDGEQPAQPDVSMAEPERTAASPLETTVKELVETGIEKEVAQIIHEGIAAEVLINKEREAAAAATEVAEATPAVDFMKLLQQMQEAAVKAN